MSDLGQGAPLGKLFIPRKDPMKTLTDDENRALRTNWQQIENYTANIPSFSAAIAQSTTNVIPTDGSVVNLSNFSTLWDQNHTVDLTNSRINLINPGLYQATLCISYNSLTGSVSGYDIASYITASSSSVLPLLVFDERPQTGLNNAGAMVSATFQALDKGWVFPQSQVNSISSTSGGTAHVNVLTFSVFRIGGVPSNVQ